MADMKPREKANFEKVQNYFDQAQKQIAQRLENAIGLYQDGEVSEADIQIADAERMVKSLSGTLREAGHEWSANKLNENTMAQHYEGARNKDYSNDRLTAGAVATMSTMAGVVAHSTIEMIENLKEELGKEKPNFDECKEMMSDIEKDISSVRGTVTASLERRPFGIEKLTNAMEKQVAEWVPEHPFQPMPPEQVVADAKKLAKDAISEDAKKDLGTVTEVADSKIETSPDTSGKGTDPTQTMIG